MENAGLIWFFYVIVPVLGFVATIYLSRRAAKKEEK